MKACTGNTPVMKWPEFLAHNAHKCRCGRCVFFVLPRRFVNGLGLLSVMTVTAPPGMWRAHSQRIPMFSPQSPCGKGICSNVLLTRFATKIYRSGRHSLGKRCPWPGGEKSDLSTREMKIWVIFHNFALIFLLDSSMVLVFCTIFWGV